MSVTLADVRAEAMDTIRKLKSKEIDVPTANSVKGCLDVIINTAKAQIDFVKALPLNVQDEIKLEEVLVISGVFRDEEQELDSSLKQIKESNETYNMGGE